MASDKADNLGRPHRRRTAQGEDTHPRSGLRGGCRTAAPDFSSKAMIADIDIWRAANILLKRHGADAATVAVEGCAVWKRILAAVDELTRTKPAEGERVN